MSTITVHELVTGYGKLEVLHGVSLDAEGGAVTCVFGPNGSGKSTLVKAIAGALGVWSGRVRLDDDDLTRLASHQVVRRGLVLMPQGGGVFPQLSVLENLRVGGYSVASRQTVNERIEDLLEEFPALRPRLAQDAGSLSGGEQMMLAIARALVVSPRFLLFDEPSAGLSPKIVSEALRRISRLRERGVGVLMVEQNIREAMQIADRIYVLVGGRKRFEGSPAEIEKDEQLMELYLGGGE